MATDDAEFADRLNRFLDALVAGTDRSPNGLLPPDHELAATARQLQAHDDAPPADPRFADRLLEDLMHTTTAHDPSLFPLTLALPTVRERHTAPRSVSRVDTSRPAWPTSQLATAALVLLVLVGSFVALGSLRERTSAWLPMLPAITGTPTAEGGIVTETLIDVADAPLPMGPVQLYVLVTELQPGVSASLGGQVGTMSYRVEQGTVKISHSGVEQVVHAGEQWSAPVDGVATVENMGDDVARIVEADVNDALATSSLEAAYASKFSDPQGGSESFVIQAATDLTTGTGRVTLERLTLPPGTALDPYIKTQFGWVGIAAGRLGVTLEGERLPFRWDPGEERTYGLFKSLPTIPPGTEVTLRNVDDVPLVLYRLTIEPSGSGGSPAVMTAPATPGSTEAAREVLVETTVAAEALPTGEDRYFHISQATIQPDVVVTSPAELVACCPGPLLDHVLVGELTVRVEGPLRVARAGTATTPGPVEEVAPGTEVVLRAGDTALYDQALPAEYANRGAEPVQLVGGGVFIGRPLVPPPGLILNNFDSISPLPPLPVGPVTFVLERVTLPPSATLPGPPTGALRVVTSGPKVAYLPKAADGSITNLVREPIEAYALTLIPAGSESETPEATPAA